jgi:hypothetical protein
MATLDLSNKRILVTGGAAFLGRQVVLAGAKGEISQSSEKGSSL